MSFSWQVFPTDLESFKEQDANFWIADVICCFSLFSLIPPFIRFRVFLANTDALAGDRDVTGVSVVIQKQNSNKNNILKKGNNKKEMDALVVVGINAHTFPVSLPSFQIHALLLLLP